MVTPLRLASGQREQAVLVWPAMGAALHLLIIDDQPESVAGLAGQLGDRGHRVEISTDSMEALRLLAEAQSRRDPFSLLLVDVNLPGLDGPGLILELRHRGDLTPAIFVTGYHSVTARLRSDLASLRALSVVTKPVPIAEIDRWLDHIMRQARASTQDRRSSEYGLGSGGHQAIGIGSGGHPLVGNVPGPSGTDEPFYGTSRSFRAKLTTPIPTDGPLSRVQRPAAGNDIIPDAVVTGRFQPPAAPLPPPTLGASCVRRSVLSPLPMPDPSAHGLGGLSGKSQGGQSSGSRSAHRQPSGFFPATPPAGNSETLRRHGDFTPLGSPMVGYRDPVTGEIKRRPSGIIPPELPAQDPYLPSTQRPTIEPPRPGTTSRFRRSVGVDPAPSQQAHLSPPLRPPPATSGTSRIRRGLTSVAPVAPATPELPTCAVACAHCQGQFTVVIKAEAYTVLCVHCGQLNRIDPL